VADFHCANVRNATVRDFRGTSPGRSARGTPFDGAAPSPDASPDAPLERAGQSTVPGRRQTSPPNTVDAV
jgi:hypothetical protein